MLHAAKENGKRKIFCARFAIKYVMKNNVGAYLRLAMAERASDSSRSFSHVSRCDSMQLSEYLDAIKR
jgi:hypothetical protein